VEPADKMRGDRHYFRGDYNIPFIKLTAPQKLK